MYYYGGFQGNFSGCAPSPTFGCCGPTQGSGFGSGAIVLVLFILLVIVLGARLVNN